ncbi:hypothetical protein [Nocardioides yefusunii]|uniref:SPOR domain-containing protein n=1 Tax=Nocardioides yefusunii TaxID=2500546 RepID=A0ABW1QUG4_9ACTN|nr:hypothetical protein [Nocardioides yefusunii]
MGIFTRKQEFWWCFKHEAVEPRNGCKNADRFGPYASEAEAARALEIVAERNDEWANDPNWNDDAPGDDGAEQRGNDEGPDTAR